VEALVTKAYGLPQPFTGLVELAYTLLRILSDANSFLPFVIWKPDQIQGLL
jgi:hypothetical protein